MTRLSDLTGQRFGRLLVLFDTGERSDGKVMWQCRCNCGKEIKVRSSNLKSGNTKSCGCFKQEAVAKVGASTRKHGNSGRPAAGIPRSITYSTWIAMKQRCYCPTSGAYHKYGAKGIKVCDRWRFNFVKFVEDMGFRPSAEYSIDRINNQSDYTPDNCRWATRSEQNLNRSIGTT